MISIAQANLDRSVRVVGEFREKMIEERVEIAMIQEPYIRNNIVKGFGSARVYSVKGVFPWAAVIIINEKLGAMKVNSLTNSNCVCVEILPPTGNRFYAISMYFQFSEHIEEYLMYLRKVKRKLKGEVVIISADANAKSELWGSPKEDSRGALLREVIEMDGWYIANDKRYGPTFDNGRTSSFIDITLTNRKVNTIMVNWEVRGDWITGTHKVITFKVNRTECRQPFINRTDKGNIKFQFHKANWGRYKECLSAEKYCLENISFRNKMDIIEYEKLIRK
ncbi:hypothetical protein J437_LFUL007397 [Ladona fulva]|uniref:Endonuclease/exonuclease/phosphatase domain-containing protein n=1 Tax=Ladona fulva TaxID=123851 RepID=A0A8K0NVJ8_LADFU|nr:hypothetical protein J437_LFUL007397 [Ladona fulva]